MALVDTKEVNALAQRAKDLLAGLGPDDLRLVVKTLNEELAEAGVAMKHLDDVAATAKDELAKLAAFTEDARALLLLIENVIKAGKVTITFGPSQ